jgi:hypothetical protein
MSASTIASKLGFGLGPGCPHGSHRGRWRTTGARCGVSLSMLPQGQAPLMRNVMLALSRMEARSLRSALPRILPISVASPNVALERYVLHSAVLPQAAVLITQCGIGQGYHAWRAASVCPIISDQPDNAAGVAAPASTSHATRHPSRSAQPSSVC